MSGSYGSLNTKYNLLLALIKQNGDATLQTVINNGDNLEGVAPANGQAITYDGTNVVWGDVITPTPDLQTVTDVGSATTNNISIDRDDTVATYSNTNVDITRGTRNIKMNIDTGFTTFSPTETLALKLADTSVAVLTIADSTHTLVDSAEQTLHWKPSDTSTIRVTPDVITFEDNGSFIDNDVTNSTVSMELRRGGISFINSDGTGSGVYTQTSVSLTDIDVQHTLYITPTQITVDGVSGTTGQAILKTATGYEWGDVLIPIPTLDDVTTVGNTTSNDILVSSLTSTNTISGDGSIINDLAEYSTSRMYLNQGTENIVINPSIVLNTTEDGNVNSGIKSIYTATSTIGRSNSFSVVHNMDNLNPIITQSLHEVLGNPLNYNRNEQTPTNITLSSSISPDTQTLDLYTGLSTNQIQSTGSNLQIISATDFADEVNFNSVVSPPHCDAVPSNANDLANKSYVDSRLVNSGSGTNLYFNYNISDGLYKQLGTSIIVAIIPPTAIITPQSGTQTIASFITETGYPGTTSIPSGIWEINQFGRQVGGNTGVLRYFFTLSKMDNLSNVVLLGTSGFSADINTSVTDIFFAQLPLAALTLLSTDRLIVKIFSLGTGTDVGHTLESYYQSGTYSYITTPLVSGSNFLSLNNVFTGSNSFTNTTNIGSLVVSTNTLNSNSTNTNINIGSNLTNGAGVIKIGESQVTSELQLAICNGRNGNVRFFDGASSAGTLYIANGGNQSTTVNIGSATNSRCPINIGAGGVLSIGEIAIGSTTRAMTIKGSSSSTFVGGTANLEGSITAYPTVGTNVPTTSWVDSALTYFLGVVHSWTATQTFSAITTDKIDSTATTSTLLVGDNIINGRIDIGAHTDVISGTGVINIGRTTGVVGGTGTININGTVGATNIGLVKIIGNQVNPSANNTNIYFGEASNAGSILIGNNQTSGIINIGAGTGRLTGTNGAINIGTGVNATGTPSINIGSTTKIVNLVGNASSSISISSGTIGCGAITAPSLDNSTTLNLGITTATTTNLGRIGGITNIYGTSSSTYSGGTANLEGSITAYPTVGTNVPTTSWVSSALASFLGVVHSWTATQTFSDIITATIESTNAIVNLYTTQTTGVLNIGTNAGRTATGIINIGTGAGAGNAINIGTGTGIASTTKTVSIGGTDTSSSREYDILLNNIKFKLYNSAGEWNYSDQASTLPFNFYGRQTVGVLNIAGGSGVARSGAVNIASQGNNSCSVNIANSAGTAPSPTSGSVNIANGTGVAGAYTTTVNIATGSTTGAVSIGNVATPIAIKAASGSLALGSSTIGCGAITTTAPISLGTIPVSSLQLGYSFKLTPVASIALSGVVIIVNAQIIPTGIWLISGSLRVVANSTTNAHIITTLNSGGTTTIGVTTLDIVPSTATQYYSNVSGVFTGNGATTLTIETSTTLVAGTAIFNPGVSNSTFHIHVTRIG